MSMKKAIKLGIGVWIVTNTVGWMIAVIEEE